MKNSEKVKYNSVPVVVADKDLIMGLKINYRKNWGVNAGDTIGWEIKKKD